MTTINLQIINMLILSQQLLKVKKRLSQLKLTGPETIEQSILQKCLVKFILQIGISKQKKLILKKKLNLQKQRNKLKLICKLQEYKANCKLKAALNKLNKKEYLQVNRISKTLKFKQKKHQKSIQSNKKRLSRSSNYTFYKLD